MGAGQDLYRRAKHLIPGGTQLLSKRPEMFLPEQWPSYYAKAKGAEVWDLDGTKYVDMTHFGVGACILGHADDDVDAAAQSAIARGVMSTLNCPEEVELAELLLELHPWAEMVRYSRCGGEVMAMAVRIARAATGRDKVAFCGYHGWHDWYLSSNLADDRALDGHLLAGLEPAGVPRGLTGTMLPFKYNDIGAFRTIMADHGPSIAAVVMEPSRSHGPAPGFLEEIRATSRSAGVVLIFDEVTSGFRQNCGGIHLRYGVRPDLAAFAKGMSNGYAMAALIGVREVMQAAQRSFISSTYWTERIGPSAALATIRKHRDHDVAAHLSNVGERVQAGWRRAADLAGLAVDVGGIPALSHFSFQVQQAAAAMTLFTQSMLARGFLAGGSLYASYAHKEEHLTAYLTACNAVFQEIAAAVRQGRLEQSLRGPVKHGGFQRLAD
ncbi:MAG: aminotransferase class III-fold pyridoxal phosphate-dependent enzyme [Deltaproteobacteria bacterium]|nr:aminotransferase class III-fold pyridoxal phosphate-dependent enzyme [Deltaproteobacteria bacterium]